MQSDVTSQRHEAQKNDSLYRNVMVLKDSGLYNNRLSVWIHLQYRLIPQFLVYPSQYARLQTIT